MNLGELIASARRKAFDTGTPGKLDPDEWVEYANDAQNEACRRARLLTDSSTTPICSIAIVSGTALYPLDDRVLFVRRVKLASKTTKTPKLRVDELDAQYGAWESATGTIEAWCPDFETGKIRFYKTPTATDTAALTVIRMPLEQMAANSDEPEVPERYHMGLVNWMLHLYFAGDDAEVADKTKADKYEARFIAEFGPKSSAINEQWIAERQGYDDDEGLF